MMVRTVFCIKLKKEAEGLAIPPLPGSKGEWIFENVSQAAWSEWQAHQTRLINEKHLNLLNPDTRTYLMEQMENFFADKAVDTVEGYVPEDEKSAPK